MMSSIMIQPCRPHLQSPADPITFGVMRSRTLALAGLLAAVVLEMVVAFSVFPPTFIRARHVQRSLIARRMLCMKAGGEQGRSNSLAIKRESVKRGETLLTVKVIFSDVDGTLLDKNHQLQVFCAALSCPPTPFSTPCYADVHSHLPNASTGGHS